MLALAFPRRSGGRPTRLRTTPFELTAAFFDLFLVARAGAAVFASLTFFASSVVLTLSGSFNIVLTALVGGSGGVGGFAVIAVVVVIIGGKGCGGCGTCT